MRILFLALQLQHCRASPGGVRSAQWGPDPESLRVFSGEIYLIKQELQGRVEGSRRGGTKKVGRSLWEREGTGEIREGKGKR